MALDLSPLSVGISATAANTWLEVRIPAGCSGVIVGASVTLYYQRSGAGLSDGGVWAVGAAQGMTVVVPAQPYFIQISPSGNDTAIYLSTGAIVGVVAADPVPIGAVS